MSLIGEEGMPIHVLLIEDSPGDVRLTLEAFAEVNPSVALQVAIDGKEAMAILRREGPRPSPPPRPYLARFEPAKNRRPSGSGRNQER